MPKKTPLLIMLALLAHSLLFPKTTLIKNISLWLPNGSLQNDSFILIRGAKIAQTGLMKAFAPMVVDYEYDLKGAFAYPAFIDAFYSGFGEQRERRLQEGGATPDAAGRSVDKNVRKPYEERNLFIRRKLVDALKPTKAAMDKLIASGFAVVQVVPENGIIGGESAVLSLVSANLKDAVLVPGAFMTLAFNPNPNAYPTTAASILAELRQLKEDVAYYQQMKILQFSAPEKRQPFQPELDVLNPYFQGEKRWLVLTRNLTEQRLAEFFVKDVAANPVLVLNPDFWRRAVDSRLETILPLDFKPPAVSWYALHGDRDKKAAEESLYPQKIAAWLKTNERAVLAPPAAGDYPALFKNIGVLLKQGVPEDKIIRMLTANPARLLGISRWTGSLEPGKLANIAVSDKRMFAEKMKIKKVWVEGELSDIEGQERKGEPPAASLSGTWKVKIESPMGNFELKMTISHEGNQFSGKLVSAMIGSLDIQDGFISGKNVSFSVTAPIGGEQMTMTFSGTVENQKLEGKVNVGSFGEASWSATPEAATLSGEEQ